ncbi:MFS transporter [Kribbella sp. NPDC023855]|uniref:MFS transporter n=1 Tax=Kribbella sp. NPDC023855 TaxID=3154698 RepID=UPI0033D90A56
MLETTNDPQSSTTPPDPRRWKALALLCTAYFMIIVDSQIVILALPSIESDLGLGLRSSQWVMSAYLLTFGGLLLLGGRTADLLGGRRMFLVGTALFLVASLACGLAWSSGVLVGARAVQGAAAAIMAPTAMAVLMSTFAVGPERNRAVGIWTGVGAFGATAALLIGGPITEGLGWPWIFLINLPLALVVLVVGPRLLRETPVAPGRRSYDPLGAVTVTVALGLLVYGVVEAPEAGWGSAQTPLLLGASAVLLAAFVLIERRAKAPLTPLRIFRSTALVGGNVMTLLVAMTIYGGALMMSVYAQQVLGYSAVRFGLSTAVYAFASVVGSNLAGPLTTRFGYPKVAICGATTLAAGAFLLSRVSAGGSYWIELFPALVVFGAGIGVTVVASAIAALSSAAPAEAGLASGINNSVFQVGAALGIALCSSVAATNVGDGLLAGVRAAFLACFAFALLCLTVAAVVGLVRRRQRAQ